MLLERGLDLLALEPLRPCPCGSRRTPTRCRAPASSSRRACSRCTNAGSVRLSARALPNHWIGRLRAISSSQNARERLDVQRDGVAPQIEELDAELAVAALDLVDQRLGAALAELVPLVDRRDAEVAGVRAAAAGLDDHVRLVDQRQRVVARAASRSHAGGGVCRKPVNVPCARCGTTVPPWRQVRLGTVAEPSSDSSAASCERRRPPARRRTCRRRRGARAIDSAGAVEACGPKQNIGAP